MQEIHILTMKNYVILFYLLFYCFNFTCIIITFFFSSCSLGEQSCHFLMRINNKTLSQGVQMKGGCGGIGGGLMRNLPQKNWTPGVLERIHETSEVDRKKGSRCKKEQRTEETATVLVDFEPGNSIRYT